MIDGKMDEVGTATPYDRLRAEFRWNLPAIYNVALPISAWAASHPNDTALIVVDRKGDAGRFSYSLLDQYSNRLANRLRAAGVARGDRVAVMLSPSFEAAAAHLAAMKAGLVVVPIYTGATMSALQLRLLESRAKALLLDRRYLSLIEEMAPAIEPQNLKILALRDAAAHDGELLDRAVDGARSDFEIVPTAPRDPAFLVFTSGSEGEPKGVLHGHVEVLAARSSFGLRSHPPAYGELAWSTADWSWLMGLNIALVAWQTGGTVLVQEDAPFSPGRAMKLMADFGVHHASLPPSALTLLQKTGTGRHHPRLRSLTTGGEALPPQVFDWVTSRFGIVLDELYAMSECPALIGTGDLIEARRGALGVALPGHDVQVVDEHGAALPAGEAGRIAVHKSDPGLFLGYWQGGLVTPPVFTGDYFLTSDVARKDDQGYFWYLGRADDVIKSGSYRIGPGEIEDCAVAHAQVELAGAVGVADPLLGQVVKLWVQLKRSQTPSDELKKDILRHLRQRLAIYQLPRAIEFVEAMPLTSTGKINRRELRLMN